MNKKEGHKEMKKEHVMPHSHYLANRMIAMPRDTNPGGDIFGGWLVSQMDLAAGSVASTVAMGRVVTVAINALTFHKPVFVGDEVSCYAEVTRIGNTSMDIKVETWVRRSLTKIGVKVTEGTFTFVAIDKHRKPRKIHQKMEEKIEE